MKKPLHAITVTGPGHAVAPPGHRQASPGAAPGVLRRAGWHGVMLAGSGLAALRAGQACTELELGCYHGGGASGEALVEHARRLGCDALHPGEAVAEEQWRLARACARGGLAFIGPDEALVATVCDDAAVRQLMREAGLPLGEFAPQAARVHLPVLADCRGQALALVEHELLDEGFAMAPSERLTPEQRAYLGQLAVQGARSLGLVGLATLSFSLADNRLGFVGMRPGLTGYEGLAEVLSGLDLAVEQLRLVAGERLRRPRVGHMGHGPGRPGQARWRLLRSAAGHLGGGPGVRLDRSSPEGDTTEVRLLVWGRDGAEAGRRERRALAEWCGDARAMEGAFVERD
ncbi:biotin carboxylase N-terminal domain-containing protein [Billgrantia lactosivorans]|uniref:ATP-binding protein n=1 Tax=Billgrantia lactosivorans TaxID=2185141 RepID=UPI0013A69258|nr:biotin carboxylase N-terminal domain-containing protein [Halomonas lactosivorans]